MSSKLELSSLISAEYDTLAGGCIGFLQRGTRSKECRKQLNSHYPSSPCTTASCSPTWWSRSASRPPRGAPLSPPRPGAAGVSSSSLVSRGVMRRWGPSPMSSKPTTAMWWSRGSLEPGSGPGLWTIRVPSGSRWSPCPRSTSSTTSSKSWSPSTARWSVPSWRIVASPVSPSVSSAWTARPSSPTWRSTHPT